MKNILILKFCIAAFSMHGFAQVNYDSLSVNKNFALFFAVNQYQDKRISPLENPIADAKRIAEILKTTYGFDTTIVENPTYEDIARALEEYRRNFASGRYDTEGQLLIFFSGHGSLHLTNGYFLPANVNLDDLKRSAFNYKIWRDDIDAIPCKHILVAIDACYSGTFDPTYGMKNNGLFGTRSGELSEGQRLLTEHDKHKTRLFFTSGETDQPTPDKSDFAKKFAAALLTKGYDDGILTSSELFSNHLERAVPRPRMGEFGGDEAGSSFIFIFNNKDKKTSKPKVQREVEAWERAQTINTIESYKNYLETYPNGDFAEKANQSIDDIKRKVEFSDWTKIKEINTIKGYETFINLYPNSVFNETAKDYINNILIKRKADSFNIVNEIVFGNKFNIGEKAMEIALPNKDGEILNLSDLKGKVVLIYFWASWCAPCYIIHPQLVKFWANNNRKGFEIYSIAILDKKEGWQKRFENDNMLWKYNVIDSIDSVNEKNYQVKAVPYFVILNKKGKVISSYTDKSKLNNVIKDIENLLK